MNWTGAPCLATEADYWFSDDDSDRQWAQTLCQTCPFRVECEEKGEGEQFGVWGGVDKTQVVIPDVRPSTGSGRKEFSAANRSRRQERWQVVRQLCADGLTQAEIAKRLKISPSSVSYILRTNSSEENAA